MEIKILSLNIWRYYGKWTERKEKIIDFIQKENPDIIFLQEVFDDRRHNEIGNNQSIQLNEKLKYKNNKYAIAEKVLTESQKTLTDDVFDGLSCLTNFKLISHEKIKLSQQNEDKHSRIIQKVTLEINGQPLTFFHTHFSNRDDWAKEHLKETLQISNKENIKPIIIGDLNIKIIEDITELSNQDFLFSYEFKEYLSYPMHNMTLDYALLPKDKFSFIDLKCELDGLSDHRPLLLKIKINE